jgi:hypothetical protein
VQQPRERDPFTKTVELGSLRRAAQVLGVSPQAFPVQLIVCASPAYVERYGAPRSMSAKELGSGEAGACKVTRAG